MTDGCWWIIQVYHEESSSTTELTRWAATGEEAIQMLNEEEDLVCGPDNPNRWVPTGKFRRDPHQ